ncbi:Rieske (2Fe-2S) region [Calothrix sp. NIES-4071]|nr:Rieske (2Fe-2S) region [Calothrix sp. NIES-4071]BAZ57893.1 Rieske (2Fe-2S) region [Calothrix sp. NIES-4105]
MTGRFPFSPYPNGWFRVAYSDQLRNGTVQPLHYFGKDLVLLRTQNGTAKVFDAHCPHFGAHLGYGGWVEGNAIVCPFHGWRFGESGHCLSVPYSEKSPPKAQLYSYPVYEANGLILVYYHSHQEPPTWEMPTLPQWNQQDWTPFLRRSWHIRTHPQDMAENALDTAHLLWLHGQSFKAVTDSKLEINGAVLTHRLRPNYRLTISGKFGIDATGMAEISSYGLGCQVSYTKIKALIEFHSLALFFLTPIDEEIVDVHILVSTKQIIHPAITYLLRHKSMTEITYNLKQDIPIWENKIYQSQPLLSNGDGPITSYRRWAQQFYTLNTYAATATTKTLGVR